MGERVASLVRGRMERRLPGPSPSRPRGERFHVAAGPSSRGRTRRRARRGPGSGSEEGPASCGHGTGAAAAAERSRPPWGLATGFALGSAPLAAAADTGVADAVSALAGEEPDGMALALRVLAVVTVLGVVPSAALLTTCFPRVVIVLSFLRRALGARDLPPNLVVFGLSLLLTVAVMLPVWREVWSEAYVPLVETGEITFEQALTEASEPVKRFMLGHVWRNDRESLRLFYELSRSGEPASTAGSTAGAAKTGPPPPQKPEDLGFFVVLPAFVLSEIETAFRMGFLVFLPFVLIDLVVSAVLVSMGMFMLPPNLVSLPVKVLVFVLVDGWTLVVSEVAMSLQSAAG